MSVSGRSEGAVGGGRVRSIGRSRLAALPGGGARAARVGFLLGVVVFVGSVLLLLSAALWPLGGVGSLPVVEVPSVPSPPGAVVEPPGGLVVSLSDDHVFSVLRRPLAERPGLAVAGAEGGGSEVGGGGEVSDDGGGAASGRDADDGVGVVIEVADPETARPDIRASFEGVRLFGLFGEGEVRGAVLGYVHSARANDPRFVEEGGRFVVPGSRPRGGEAAEGLEWELTAVDGARDRVLISHDGQTFAIALFGEEADRSPLEVSGVAVDSGGGGGASASADGAEAGREEVADDGTVVVRRSAREIEERLREAGEDASIEELFRLMDLGGARGGAGGESGGEGGGGGDASGDAGASDEAGSGGGGAGG